MLKRLALAAFLAACAVPAAPVVPAELRTCPAAPDAPHPLPSIVTPEGLRARYSAEHAARIETEAALATCAARLEQLVALIERTRP